MTEQTKLSRHQRMILQIMAEEIKDDFWGIPITYLSRIAACRLERRHGDYVEDRKEWRKRRRAEEVNRFRRGEGDRETLEFMLWCLRDSPRRRDEVQTEKWRATFSRCLKRLEARGLITRISQIRYERREDGPYWARYVGGRTRRVALTQSGKILAESLGLPLARARTMRQILIGWD